MKRRIFIKNTALTGVGIGLTGLNGCASSQKKGSPTQKEDPKLFFKLSLAQWSVHKMIRDGQFDAYNFAAKAREWGFEGLEYVNHLYNSKIEESSSFNAGVRNVVNELVKRSKDQGMNNLVMMVDMHSGGGNMAVMDTTQRDKAVEMHYPWVDVTAGLGCHSMRVNMFGEPEAARWKEASIAALGKLGEYAAKQNINILIENHGGFTSNASLLMEVINEVNMANCGTLPDFGNFCLRREKNEQGGTSCVEEYDKYKGIKELMPRAKAVSAKSHDFDNDGIETTIDYKRMLQIVKDAQYNGYIGVEYEGSRLSEEEGILATRNLLIKIGKEISTT